MVQLTGMLGYIIRKQTLPVIYLFKSFKNKHTNNKNMTVFRVNIAEIVVSNFTVPESDC